MHAAQSGGARSVLHDALEQRRVAQNFFTLLGVQPALGRSFTADESLWNGPRAVDAERSRFWTRRFASDPAIVGRTLTLERRPYTVVGVLPASFDFSTVFAPGSPRRSVPAAAARPRTIEPVGQLARVIGRLKPGVTLECARAPRSARRVRS